MGIVLTLRVRCAYCGKQYSREEVKHKTILAGDLRSGFCSDECYSKHLRAISDKDERDMEEIYGTNEDDGPEAG